MNEEENVATISDGSVDLSTDLAEMVQQLEVLNEVLLVDESKEIEEKVIEVDGVGLTQDEILAEILTTLKPDEEELLNEADLNATNQEILVSIKTSLEELNAFNEESKEIESVQHVQVIEGFYFVGLCVVVAFAVYMFWNQLSKW